MVSLPVPVIELALKWIPQRSNLPHGRTNKGEILLNTAVVQHLILPWDVCLRNKFVHQVSSMTSYLPLLCPQN